MKKIALLLSTYNGEHYLEQLLNSILSQSYTDFKLFIRDDGSRDRTIKIINKYCTKYVHFNFVNGDKIKNIGVVKSFDMLLKAALLDKDIGYFMFVDQDDIWLPHKIEYSLKGIENMDKDNIIPLLFHTDLSVVNKDLMVLSKSLWEYQNLNPAKCKLNNILVQNNVTGCAMIINRPLAEISLPIPKEAIMHDWWIALIAASFGNIGWDREVTIQYRQHGNNSVGAKKLSLLGLSKKLQEPSVVGKTIIQGCALLEQFEERMPKNKKLLVENYILLTKLNRLQRVKAVMNNSFYKTGLLRNLGFLYLLLFKKAL